MTSPPLPPRAAPATRRRWAPKVNRLPRTLKPKSLTFLKSPKSSAHASGSWRHSHLPVIFTHWDFYFDISEWHILPERAWTPALMLHLANPCAMRKVLSQTKPKGKIYKTKSLGHSITYKCLFILISRALITPFGIFCWSLLTYLIDTVYI